MKAYITKYALTSGIKEVEGTLSKVSDDVLCVGHEYFHGNGREWHSTREAAVQRAEEMRANKIKSIEKQLKKLREMTFE